MLSSVETSGACVPVLPSYTAPLPVRPRLTLRRFLPIAVLFTGGFGLYYLYVASLALGRGNRPFALFYALYGLGGVALAVSLWRVWRQHRRAVR